MNQITGAAEQMYPVKDYPLSCREVYHIVAIHFLEYCKNHQDAEISHFAKVLSLKINQ